MELYGLRKNGYRESTFFYWWLDLVKKRNHAFFCVFLYPLILRLSHHSLWPVVWWWWVEAVVSCRVEDLEVGQAVVNFASVAMVDVAWWRGKWGAEMRSGVESQLPMEVDNQFGCWTRQRKWTAPVQNGFVPMLSFSLVWIQLWMQPATKQTRWTAPVWAGLTQLGVPALLLWSGNPAKRQQQNQPTNG